MKAGSIPSRWFALGEQRVDAGFWLEVLALVKSPDAPLDDVRAAIRQVQARPPPPQTKDPTPMTRIKLTLSGLGGELLSTILLVQDEDLEDPGAITDALVDWLTDNAVVLSVGDTIVISDAAEAEEDEG